MAGSLATDLVNPAPATSASPTGTRFSTLLPAPWLSKSGAVSLVTLCRRACLLAKRPYWALFMKNTLLKEELMRALSFFSYMRHIDTLSTMAYPPQLDPAQA